MLAPVVHWALLTLLLAMAISGWLMSSAAGVGVVWFGLLPPNADGTQLQKITFVQVIK